MIIGDKNIDGGKGFGTSCSIFQVESTKMTGTIIEEDKGRKEPMITLRKFNASDEETISSKMNVPADVAKRLISEWDTTQYQGRYFEMFAIAEGDTVVGTISLYELSHSIISIGIEVFEEYRKHGYARAAMQQAIQLAQAKKYPVAFQQVRVDNTASIRLHESLGFEKEDSVYTNKKGRDVYLFVKAL